MTNDDAFTYPMGNRRGSGREETARLIRWWNHRKEADRTHMDLRRWLDARYDEGWRAMFLEERPAGPAHWYLVLAGSNARHRDRALWPAEQRWLLQTWPAELRTVGPSAGLLA